MPAAAPHATSRRSCGGENFRQRPIPDASTAASDTIGPSRPIEPPDPMENNAAVDLTSVESFGRWTNSDGQEFVLVPAEKFEQIQKLLDRIASRAGWDDVSMDEYETYRKKA